MADTKPPQPDLHVREGQSAAQVSGPPRGDQEHFEVKESRLDTDRVITDHNDPLGTEYQFLGVEGPSPTLPIGGAGHDPRTPDEVFAKVKTPSDDKKPS